MIPEKKKLFHLYPNPTTVIPLDDTKCTISQRKISHLFKESQEYLSDFPYLVAEITDVGGNTHYYDGLHLHKAALERVRNPSAFTSDVKVGANSTYRPLLLNPNTGMEVGIATFFMYTRTGASKTPELSKFLSYSEPKDILQADHVLSCFDYSKEGVAARMRFLNNYKDSATSIEHCLQPTISAICHEETVKHYLKNSQHLALYAKTSLNLGYSANAIKFSETAAQLIEEELDPNVLLELADIHYDLRNEYPNSLATALDFYTKHLNVVKAKTSGHVFYRLGEIHRLGGTKISINHKSAITFYKAALKKEPLNFLIYASLISILQNGHKEIEDSKEASDCFNEALKKTRGNEELFNKFYEAVKKHTELNISADKLKAVLEEEIKRNPKNAFATQRLGKFCSWAAAHSTKTLKEQQSYWRWQTL